MATNGAHDPRPLWMTEWRDDISDWWSIDELRQNGFSEVDINRLLASTYGIPETDYQGHYADARPVSTRYSDDRGLEFHAAGALDFLDGGAWWTPEELRDGRHGVHVSEALLDALLAPAPNLESLESYMITARRVRVRCTVDRGVELLAADVRRLLAIIARYADHREVRRLFGSNVHADWLDNFEAGLVRRKAGPDGKTLYHLADVFTLVETLNRSHFEGDAHNRLSAAGDA